MKWPWKRSTEGVRAAQARLLAAQKAAEKSEETIKHARTVLTQLDEHRRSNGFAELIEKAMREGRKT